MAVRTRILSEISAGRTAGSVHTAQSKAGLDTAAECFVSSHFDLDGGHIGFAGWNGCTIDELTVEYDDANHVRHTDIVENFTLNSNYAEDQPTHDNAGNLTYDGLCKYAYDGWNRLAAVKRAYRQDDQELIVTATVATITYDGLGRRIVKAITNSGDWNMTYNFYYDGQSTVEEQNGSGDTIKQHVWGTQYIDELVQTGLNDNPGSDDDGGTAGGVLPGS